MTDPDPGAGPGPEERLRLSPAAALLLAGAVFAFITLTAYASSLPLVHHDWALAALEGAIFAVVVGVVAGGRGLVMRERRPRPPRRSGGSRRPPA